MKTQARFIAILYVVSMGIPTGSFCQEIPGQGAPGKQLQHETRGDAFIPVSKTNKHSSPAYTYFKKAGSKSTGSSIITTQVNVDSAGQNILGDAANEPNITINPKNPGELAIGWRQFDSISSNFRQAGWSYSSNAGQSWTFPGVIEPGVFRSDPVLDYDTNGTFYYNSLTVDTGGNYVCKVFKSTNGGLSWNTGTDAAGGDKQWMAIDRTTGIGSGNIYSFWSSAYSSCMPGNFTRSTNGGNSYESCTFADGDPSLGTMAVGIAGELYIGGSDYLSNDLVVCKSQNVQQAGSLILWDAPVYVFMDGYVNGWVITINPAGLLGQVNIDVDRSAGPGQGNVYLLASLTRISNADPGDVMFARSTDGGLSWGTPMQINDDNSTMNTQWFGTLSVAPNGRIDAVWLDTRDAPFGSDSSALYYSFSTDHGVTWSINEKMSDSFDPHVGYPNQNKMGDYFDMISDNTGAHLAWANTLNGEEDVYYSYIIPFIGAVITPIADNTTTSVFPNPTKGPFTIATSIPQASIEIYNVMGERIQSHENPGTKSKMDISNQPAGMFFLKIRSQDGEILVKKVIKE